MSVSPSPSAERVVFPGGAVTETVVQYFVQERRVGSTRWKFSNGYWGEPEGAQHYATHCETTDVSEGLMPNVYRVMKQSVATTTEEV